MTLPDTSSVVRSAFERRAAALADLTQQATALALACRDTAERFTRGGRLLVFGNGAATTDAQHVAVEFVHPVIAGKRALPALSLVSDAATLMGVASGQGLDTVYAHQLGVLGRPADIALGLSSDGNCVNVRGGLAAARAAGMLTIGLVGGDGGAIMRNSETDHCLVVASPDPLVVKEGHVTLYHLLWELVHVFFDSPDAPKAAAGVESLYPFLYGGGTPQADVLEAAAASARHKLRESAELRAQAGVEQGDALASCAATLGAAFDVGACLVAFGNGGSSSDAQDVVHTFMDPPHSARPLPALGLTNDVAVVTALSNDVSFDVVFARQVRAFARSGDIAVALSTSGGSRNVLAALDEAASMGLVTVGMAGYGGGQMAELDSLQHLFAVPSSSVHRVQEVQTTLYHVLWEATQAALARS